MIVCPLCAAVARTTLYRNTRSGDVQRCTACGFVYSAPPGETRAAAPAFTDDPAVYRLNAQDRLGRLERRVALPGRRLLDVGCYDGNFTLAAQELGFLAEGVEPSPVGVELARAKGLTVAQGTLEDAPLTGPYDAIAMIHVLEQFADPLVALERARTLLHPAGALLIEVPNFAAWSRKLLGRRWRQFIPDHERFFEPYTLRRCLERTGWAVVDLRPVGKIASVALLADRLRRYYSPALAGAVARSAVFLGRADARLTINLGDILLAVATVR